jgi:hypothetical protein
MVLDHMNISRDDRDREARFHEISNQTIVDKEIEASGREEPGGITWGNNQRIKGELTNFYNSPPALRKINPVVFD